MISHRAFERLAAELDEPGQPVAELLELFALPPIPER